MTYDGTPVSVLWPSQDGEAARYAREWCDALIRSGWKARCDALTVYAEDPTWDVLIEFTIKGNASDGGVPADLMVTKKVYPEQLALISVLRMLGVPDRTKFRIADGPIELHIGHMPHQ